MDGKAFLNVVRPALVTGDVETLAEVVRDCMSPSDLCCLLTDSDVDVRRVVAMTLGLVGDQPVMPCLVKCLRDPDEQVHDMAEHSLWSIWFRGGNPQAACHFRRGVALLAEEKYEHAVLQFNDAIAADPQFAEAHNQCGMALFFLEDWQGSAHHCQAAVRLVPEHFGAIAGLGHCYTEMGDLCNALRCYKRAIRINPRMHGISRAVERLEARIARHNNESGMFQSLRL